MATKDVFGEAITSFLSKPSKKSIKVQSKIGDGYEIPLPYLFRSYSDMPELEKLAIAQCKGHVLDVGAGAGAHSTHLITQGIKVHAIDVSEQAILLLKEKNIPSTCSDFFTLNAPEKFDTILMMMNGIGIVEKVNRFEDFFNTARTLLNKDGFIICDSADVSYLFEDENGEIWIDINSNYYGEVDFKMTFEATETDWFPWLFVDFNTLSLYAERSNFGCELIKQDDNSQFLAKLWPKR